MLLKIVLFSFTDRGTRLAEKLREGFAGMGHHAAVNDRSAGFREAVAEAAAAPPVAMVAQTKSPTLAPAFL